MKFVSTLLSLSCQLQEVNKTTFNLTIKKYLCLIQGGGVKSRPTILDSEMLPYC